MKLRSTERTSKDYKGLPMAVFKALGKQFRFLLCNLKHPSLHAKKYSEALTVWQGRVMRDWCFYFKIEGSGYVVLSIISHTK